MHLPSRLALSVWWLATACSSAALAAGCSTAASVSTESADQGADLRPVEIKHEKCDLESKSAVRTDVNNDGRSEITRVMAGMRELCRAVDLNFDGRVDSYVYFDDQGKLRRRESDFDRDGVIDEIAILQGGKIVRKDRETNLDAKLDTWDFYTGDALVRRERDTNADGRVDQWWSWPDPGKPECPLVDTDTDGDGRPDQKLDVCKDRDAQNAAAAAVPAAASVPTQAVPPAGVEAGIADAGGER